MKDLNLFLDHTLLKAEATPADILAVTAEAKLYHTASVCVNACYTSLVARELAGSGVKTCVVVGFPLGAMASGAKAVEAALAVRDGAQEVDMVMNIGAAKAGDWNTVQADISAVVNAAKPAIVKVIIETCLLTDDEKVKACLAAKAAGAAFVKTSTGFSTGGATIEDIALMRKTVGPEMGVKASGGVRTRYQVIAFIEAGATRIGCSSTKNIME
jgi:deoxyribose-phosphate aldolase